MTKAVGKDLPFRVLYKEEIFLLLDIQPDFAYEDNHRTDQLTGYKYTVVDTDSYDKIRVKIKGQQKPLMPPEELEERRSNGERIAVEFINGVDKLYLKRDGSQWSVEDSFSAEDILIVEQN